jgi:hypothetical protein
MRRKGKRWIGAVALACLVAPLMLAGCPNALDNCENTLTCPPPPKCDAGDADPDACEE